MTVATPPAHLGASRNKPRVYLAYYIRGASHGGPPYHVGIIARPHPMDNDAETTLRMHAVNTVVPAGSPENDGADAQVLWSFESKFEAFVGHQLAGVLYLGKLPGEKTFKALQEACARVPVARHGEDGWRCKNWVWDALEVR